MHHHDLMARDQRPEHAQIELKTSESMQRKIDLLPKIAGEEPDAAQRNILERKIARGSWRD